ncbi:cysteine hydrolase [Pandoraea communis]|uniref:Cysteine hydrolase n=1 Tax=Pandoraea communis TaxID=2508297 RepID=A0A5E4U619_9BURK|nr:isochorismatase family cysteine hydrolase [Pandoraea communis]VVD94922.1 cysteine hydrolase [Pandoraea communis]
MKKKTLPSSAQISPAIDEFACGPSVHSAWTVNGSHISLVRRVVKPRPVAMDAAPQPIEIDVARSALIVIDMQNDFCHSDGWFAQKGVSVKAARKPIPVIAGLLPTWRKAGGNVVWLNWGVRADLRNLSATVQFKGKRSHDGVGYGDTSPIDRGPALVRGEWGAQVVQELTVASTDISVEKHRLSGFWDNELDSILRNLGVTTLLFAGINTDRCVFSTLQDAAFIGYDCVLLEDACATSSPAYVTRAIHFIVKQLHGFVSRADRLVESLSTQPQSTEPHSTKR